MDKEKFAEIAWGSKDTLYRVAKSILHNDTDCEDAVSQAIVNAFTKLASLKKEEYAKTWLIRIVINECYHIYRVKKREQSYEDYMNSRKCQSSFAHHLDYDEEHSELYHALMKLPVKYRITITLYYIEGYNIKEIAIIQHTTTGTVKSRLSRGRQKLKALLTDESSQEKLSCNITDSKTSQTRGGIS